VVKGTKNPEASKRLIEFLASEKATPTVEKTGMKRPNPDSAEQSSQIGRFRSKPPKRAAFIAVTS
jgi:ABC-type Fe3+ transport system substrate-binding protein